MQKRIRAYSDSPDAEAKKKWFTTWFLPTLERIDIACMTWEEIISYIGSGDRANGDALLKFYEKCLALNQPRSKLSSTEKLSTGVSTGKLTEHKYSTRPDNVFNYEEPLKQKQKEMNLDIEVEGEKLTQKFAEYLDNFKLILDAFKNNMEKS